MREKEGEGEEEEEDEEGKTRHREWGEGKKQEVICSEDYKRPIPVYLMLVSWRW